MNTEKEYPKAVVISTGHWRYAEAVDETVQILGLPYDYWYAMGEQDGNLETDEKLTPLGSEGMLYYAHFAQIEGPGYPTIVQAKGYAQSLVQSEIRWS